MPLEFGNKSLKNPQVGKNLQNWKNTGLFRIGKQPVFCKIGKIKPLYHIVGNLMSYHIVGNLMSPLICIETLLLYITESINKASNAWGLDCLRYEISEYISISVKPVLSGLSKLDKTKV